APLGSAALACSLSCADPAVPPDPLVRADRGLQLRHLLVELREDGHGVRPVEAHARGLHRHLVGLQHSGKGAGNAVEERRIRVSLLLALRALDRLPILENVFRSLGSESLAHSLSWGALRTPQTPAGGGGVAPEHVGMPADHLRRNALDDLRAVEAALL